ncbi:MAG: hypothetical protein WC211_00525 [Dehalococcoidia bacterium]
MTTTTKRLTGKTAIEAAERLGLTLSTHTDPTAEARTGVSVDDARAIAREDASLVYVDVDVMASREAALEVRVALDVAKWGEAERAASRELHARTSHALLVNAIAVADLDAIDGALVAAAAKIMTSADKRVLRTGG